jgi:hypothetical protein
MLTLHPGATETVELPARDGKPEGRPAWRIVPPDVASLVVMDDGSRAALTAGPRPGRADIVVASVRDGEAVEDRIAVRVAGRPAAEETPAAPAEERPARSRKAKAGPGEGGEDEPA